MKGKYVLDLITEIVGDDIKAKMVFDRLTEEGLLHVGFGDPEVDTIVKCFSDTFGTTKTSKADRYAARRLGSKYGSQAICGIITLMSKHAEEKYAPITNSVVELENKIVSVLKFLRSMKGDELVDV